MLVTLEVLNHLFVMDPLCLVLVLEYGRLSVKLCMSLLWIFYEVIFKPKLSHGLLC